MLEGLRPPLDSNLCKVSLLAAELSPEDNAILQAAMVDENWTSLGLATELSKRGFVVGDSVLRKHRNQGCKCAR